MLQHEAIKDISDSYYNNLGDNKEKKGRFCEGKFSLPPFREGLCLPSLSCSHLEPSTPPGLLTTRTFCLPAPPKHGYMSLLDG